MAWAKTKFRAKPRLHWMALQAVPDKVTWFEKNVSFLCGGRARNVCATGDFAHVRNVACLYSAKKLPSHAFVRRDVVWRDTLKSEMHARSHSGGFMCHLYGLLMGGQHRKTNLNRAVLRG